MVDWSDIFVGGLSSNSHTWRIRLKISIKKYVVELINKKVQSPVSRNEKGTTAVYEHWRCISHGGNQTLFTSY